jgi:DNA invertase Pin-like site-specific DNA recombinase
MDTMTPGGRMLFKCVVCFAEFERAMISSPAQVARVLVAAGCPAIRMSRTS